MHEFHRAVRQATQIHWALGGRFIGATAQRCILVKVIIHGLDALLTLGSSGNTAVKLMKAAFAHQDYQ